MAIATTEESEEWKSDWKEKYTIPEKEINLCLWMKLQITWQAQTFEDVQIDHKEKSVKQEYNTVLNKTIPPVPEKMAEGFTAH